MLPRAHRLRRSADIRRARRKGQRWSHPLLLLFAIENNGDSTRFAISASSRIGNAVVRNRVRRRIREAIRKELPGIEPGWDCLLVVKEGAPSAPFAALEQAIIELLARSGLLHRQTAE
ncbi:MAG: ribonuclease P protein component [Chloroflexota bacterium]